MSVNSSAVGALGVAARSVSRPLAWLRIGVIAAGLTASLLFIVVGLRFELQLYADGSIFSYAVAVQDAWAFHWHNISGRLFVYLFCHVPAETYVRLTGDARGGIDVYGLLFFGSQLLGLAATYAADRSRDRIIFCFACASVVCVCPLVFGYPTELWVSHAVFWPALALCHYARRGIGGFAIVATALAALVFTHEGAVVFAAAILCTLMLRRIQDPALRRAAGAFLVVMPLWVIVKVTLPPDSNFSSILVSVALNSLDITSLGCGLFLLLSGTIAGYGLTFLILRQLMPASAPLCAAAIVAVALAVYWLWFDQGLHADSRYYLRTALLIATPLLGSLAALRAIEAEGRLNPLWFLPRINALSTHHLPAQAIAGAVLLITLVHTVETAKFVAAWTDYKAAVRELAMSTASDPSLGTRSFVSAARVGDDLYRLSWPSTTQYLSVLVAPHFSPRRLVVDPRANYFWISCETAVANQMADLAVPAESRRLIRVHACLHR